MNCAVPPLKELAVVAEVSRRSHGEEPAQARAGVPAYENNETELLAHGKPRKTALFTTYGLEKRSRLRRNYGVLHVF